MKNRKWIFALVLLLVGTLQLSAQVRKYSNEFLALGVGSRSLAMANATIASAGDVTAGYWNPAGLMRIESNVQVGFMHSNYFANIAKYDYAGLAAQIDATSTAGFSFIRFGVDDIPDTSELIDRDGNINYDKIKTFSAADYAFIFSYARKMKLEGLNVGANAKIIHRKVGDFGSAWGFGIDAGATYQWKKWTFAAMARDITTTMNAWSFNLSDAMKETFTLTGNEIPENSVETTMPRLILGAAREIQLNDDFHLLAEVNLDMTTDGKRNVLIKSDPFSFDPHLGVECGFRKMIFFRCGLGNIQQETGFDGNKFTSFQPNAGIGLALKNRLFIDYAMTDLGNQSIAPYSHLFSLRLNINRSDNNP